MGSPVRIQRERRKGWRMPEGSVYVGRPTRWGNPFRIDSDLGRDLEWDALTVTLLYDAKARFAVNIADEDGKPDPLAPLRGHDLACWCPLDQPCHADVLLELANR